MLYHMVLRLLLSAAGLGLASVWLEGVQVAQLSTLFWAALLLGIANTIVRPIAVVLTLPVTFLTLGLFLIVINILIIQWTTEIVSGFSVENWWYALLFSVLLSFVTAIIESLIGSNSKEKN